MKKRAKRTWKDKNKYQIKPTSHRCLPDVWHVFKQLAKEKKRTANAALNLLIEDAIKRWKLPEP